MNNIKKFFSDLKNNGAYMFPVLMLVVASVFHLFTFFEMTTIIYIQLVFFLWAAAVALKKKLTLWPAFLFSLSLVIISSGLSFQKEYNLQEVTDALKTDNTIMARDLLESIDSEDLVKSRQYVYLQDLVSTRIQQQIGEETAKARNEFRKNNYIEVKKSVALILDYDSDNKDALYIAEQVRVRELAEFEKNITPEIAARVKEMRKNVGFYIAKKNYTDARKSIDEFIRDNPGYDRGHLVITPLSEAIDNSEKGAEIARQKQLNYKRINDALALIKKKEYKESIKLLEEVLAHDTKNRTALKLLDRANQSLSKDRSAFWKKVAIYVIIGLGILIFIKRQL